MDKYIGRRLDSRYEIKELIGMGGMAMVYKAYDSVDDKTVAIKILKDEFLGNEEFIRRFKNESKAIAVLSHPNIVKVYDVSFGDRIQYIVMEYIDGITLKEYIGQQKVVPWKEAVHFTVQILKALQHAHEKGIVHRDIKPQNIMLLQDGTIKVTDFGIARFSNNDTRTMTSKTIGSVHYIAPEQARGGVTDGKADIYSVGVMLYEMLTGQLPFEADSAVSVAIMQMQNEPKPLRELNDKIPEGIEQITLRAMRKEPKQRFATAGEMLEAIETFRRDPSVKFRYTYSVDQAPTREVESIGSVKLLSSAESAYELDDYLPEDETVSSVRSRKAVIFITLTITLLVLVMLIVFIINLVQSLTKATDVKSVDVPSFVGQLYDEIVQNKEYKFTYDITAKYDDTKPVNIVLSQSPEPDSKQVKENAVIKLTINSKSTKAEVPKVRNYLEQEAIDKLSDKYFTYEVKRVNSSDVSKGYVIQCSPQEGTEQEIGTVITLIVSEGKAPEKVTVPDVVGKSYENAKSELESAGFTTQRVMVASAVTAGQVILTDPLAGNKLTKGSLINIQVSDGSKIIRGMEQYIDLPQDEYAEIKVTIYVDAVRAEEVSGKPAYGFKKSIYLEPEGAKNHRKTVVVMIDDVRYEAFTFDFKNQTVTRDYINTDYRVKQGSDPLEKQKANAVYELETYISDMSLYYESDQNEMYGIIDEYRSSIRNATSEYEINSLLSEAEYKLDGYYQIPEEPSEEESSEEESSEEESSEEEYSEEESSEEENSPENNDKPSSENVVYNYIRNGYEDVRHGYEVLFGI